jgi:hypothetical protein
MAKRQVQPSVWLIVVCGAFRSSAERKSGLSSCWPWFPMAYPVGKFHLDVGCPIPHQALKFGAGRAAFSY